MPCPYIAHPSRFHSVVDLIFEGIFQVYSVDFALVFYTFLQFCWARGLSDLARSFWFGLPHTRISRINFHIVAGANARQAE